ncbi:MAG: OmpA family protein [Spirochaetales bacterium]|nr:OmpA family protein [Spirochaetales bacterium]
MPANPKDDRNFISHEKHELDYLLNKWDKAANKSNREILTDELKKYKADKDWAPHNRERFYEYVEAKGIKTLLADKQAQASPPTVLLDSSEEEDSYTVIKKRAAPPRKKKKGALIPLLLILAGILVISVLVFFLFLYKPGDSARMTERTPDSTETESQAAVADQAEVENTAADVEQDEEAAAVLGQFRKIVSDNTPLLFVGDQAVLLPGQEVKLDTIVKGMADLERLDLTLSGHTADTGVPSHEMELSKERAMTVKSYLEQTSDGTELKINIIGKGASEPVVKDVPVAEQQPNRRVEITVNSAE